VPSEDHTADEECKKDAELATEIRWKDYSGIDATGSDEDIDEELQITPARKPLTVGDEDVNKTLSPTEKEIINHAPGRSGSKTSLRQSQIDKVKITGALCDRLDVTPYEMREAQRIMSELNLDRFGNQKRIEKVALVVIRYVVDRTRFERAQGSDEPDVSRISSQETYKELIAEQEMDLGDVMKLSAKVLKVLKEGSSDD